MANELIEATLKGDYDAVDRLLNDGARPDETYILQSSDNIDLYGLVESQKGVFCTTPLHQASYQGKGDILRRMLQVSDVNLQVLDSDDVEPWKLAVNEEIVSIWAGKDSDIRNGLVESNSRKLPFLAAIYNATPSAELDDLIVHIESKCLKGVMQHLNPLVNSRENQQGASVAAEDGELRSMRENLSSQTLDYEQEIGGRE